MRSDKALAAVVLGCLLLSAGLMLATNESWDEDGLTVCVTLPWQKEMLERIGNGKLEAVLFVKPGGDAHGGELEVRDIISASRAIAYFYVGSGVEWEVINLPTLMEELPQVAMVNMSRDLTLLPALDDGHGHGPIDAHVWTSPANLRMMAELAHDSLRELDPENATAYTDGFNDYVGELGEIITVADTLLSPNAGKSFLVWHPAWRYLSNDYGLQEISLENPYSGGMTLEDLLDLSEMEEEFSQIFIKPDDPVMEQSEVFAARGIEVKIANPLAMSYLSELRSFIEALHESWE